MGSRVNPTRGTEEDGGESDDSDGDDGGAGRVPSDADAAVAKLRRSSKGVPEPIAVTADPAPEALTNKPPKKD
jgi:hypothetical protein